MSKILDAALSYARNGTPVFPVNSHDKHPLTEHGFKDASIDPKTIRTWWHVWPGAMIGIPSGPRSGVWILDIDVDPVKDIDGPLALGRLCAVDGHGALPKTLTSVTPRGGKHHLFRWDGDTAGIKNLTSVIGPGLDTRGAGGYFIAPPSVRADGTAYRFEDPSCEVAMAPAWLVALTVKAAPADGANRRATLEPHGSPGVASSCSRDRAWARAALQRECVRLSNNHALNIAAFNLGQIVGGGVLGEEEAREALIKGAEDCGLIANYGEPSAIKTINSGLSAGKKYPRYRS